MTHHKIFIFTWKPTRRTHWYFSPSLHPCHTPNLSWLKQQAQEGRKERKGRNIVVWHMTLVLSTSLCKRQVTQKWFSKCWLLWNQIKGSSKCHKEASEARASAGLWGFPVAAHSSRPHYSLTESQPHSAKSLQWLDFALPASVGFSSGNETVLIGVLPNTTTPLPPPTVPQGWLCKVLNAHSAHQEMQEETQTLHDCVSVPIRIPSFS